MSHETPASCRQRNARGREKRLRRFLAGGRCSSLRKKPVRYFEKQLHRYDGTLKKCRFPTAASGIQTKIQILPCVAYHSRFGLIRVAYKRIGWQGIQTRGLPR